MNTSAFRLGYASFMTKMSAATRAEYTAFNNRLPKAESLVGDDTAGTTSVPATASFTTKGLSRNNPMNVHVTRFNDPWFGQVYDPHIADLPDTELGEAAFNTMENGLRAGARNVKNKFAKNTYTPTSFVEEYTSGATPEAKANYANRIANAFGIGAGDTIALTDDNMPSLMRAIIEHENGVFPAEITDQMLSDAVAAASETKSWANRLAAAAAVKQDDAKGPVYMPNSRAMHRSSINRATYADGTPVPTRLHESIDAFLLANRENRGLNDDWSGLRPQSSMVDADTGLPEFYPGEYNRGDRSSLDENPEAAEYEWLRLLGSPDGGISSAGTNWLTRVNSQMGYPDIDWNSVDAMVGNEYAYPEGFIYTPEQADAAFAQILDDMRQDNVR